MAEKKIKLADIRFLLNHGEISEAGFASRALINDRKGEGVPEILIRTIGSSIKNMARTAISQTVQDINLSAGKRAENVRQIRFAFDIDETKTRDAITEGIEKLRKGEGQNSASLMLRALEVKQSESITFSVSARSVYGYNKN